MEKRGTDKTEQNKEFTRIKNRVLVSSLSSSFIILVLVPFSTLLSQITSLELYYFLLGCSSTALMRVRRAAPRQENLCYNLFTSHHKCRRFYGLVRWATFVCLKNWILKIRRVKWKRKFTICFARNTIEWQFRQDANMSKPKPRMLKVSTTIEYPRYNEDGMVHYSTHADRASAWEDWQRRLLLARTKE